MTADKVPYYSIIK